MKNNNLQKKRGFVILFAVTLAAILLSIALGVSNIALKEIKFGTSAKDTNNAFFAADAGVECARINDKAIGGVFNAGTPTTSTIQCNGASINVNVTNGILPVWDFKISGLGSDTKGCTNVSVDKRFSPSTTITSKGYNNGSGAGTCDPSSNSVERELTSNYGGGVVTGSGPTVQIFTTDGIFTPTTTGNIEVLVVAGGGGGGADTTKSGGGGGAGGVIYNATYAVTAGVPITVTVGSGGVGGVSGGQLATSGGNSVFGTLTAFGGGYGGKSLLFPASGGSGGGSSLSTGALGIGPQGNGGGNGYSDAFNGNGSGGGGGAGSVGVSGSSKVGGNGGDGVAYNISGVNTFYAGGGGGGWTYAGMLNFGAVAGTGGSGIGGNGGLDGSAGTDGVINTGSGGGGGSNSAITTTTGNGGAGGSGIVIIKY